jgi:hypothetical protein
MDGIVPTPAAAEREVLRHLRQRGLRVKRCAPWEQTLVPDLVPAQRDRFYALLGRYSVRLLLRDLIRDRERIVPARLCRHLPRPLVQSLLLALRRLGVLRGRVLAGSRAAVGRHSQALRLAAREADSFGDTLEWYVAEVLRREFSIPALWGVTLEGTRHGGDFDVLALPAGRLAYLEVKSAPPKHVEAQEVSAFLDRVEDLGPDLALFLEDTTLRMADKIVPLFEAALASRPRPAAPGSARCRRGTPASERPRRLAHELFEVGGRIFIVNSDPDLSCNLGLCLGAFFRSTWSEIPRA